MARRPARVRPALLLALVALAVAALAAPAPAAAKSSPYDNPLRVQIPNDGLVESCADPSVIRSHAPGDSSWYAYCTTDPLNGEDRNADGSFRFRLIPILRSTDLVSWTYVGDAFASKPDWVRDDAGMWAPDIAFVNGKYHLYFTAPDTDVPGGSAIGVGVSSSPTGPFVDSGGPVVEPSHRWTFDADYIEVAGTKYLFYGSYFGGISARQLTPDGLRSVPATQVQIAIPNRYEGAHVVRRDGFFYLFASATDCCRGPLTGYSVFVGRSENVLGPYVDKDGQSLLQGRVGGTPVLSMNGNRWVGLGHNTVFTDAAGRWWTLYHAVDRGDPYFAGATGFTKRPLLLDPITWKDGWPDVRGGLWASDTRQPGPTGQEGAKAKPSKDDFARDARLGKPVFELSDEFNGSALDPRWSWVRPAAPGTYGSTGTTFRFDTQAADLHTDSNNASVLVEAAPKHDYAVDVRMRVNLPPEGCCHNYVQGGVVAYGGDDNFLKLAHVSIWETRQTEWAKELAPVAAGFPRYGNTVVGAPGEWTTLRIVRCGGTGKRENHYRAYTRRDGGIWVRGGVWTHQLADERIGLVSMGGSGFTTEFDYVRVYRVHECTRAGVR